jgi:hypothetical protein
MGESASEWGLTGAFGGGIQVPATTLFSFRVAADYELSRHDMFDQPMQYVGGYGYTKSRLQNNLLVSAGVVSNVRR